MPICFESGTKLYGLILLTWHESWPTYLYVELHTCLFLPDVLAPLDTVFQYTQTNQAPICVPIKAGLLISLPRYPEIPNCDTGPLILPDALTPSLHAKIKHYLGLQHSDPQTLALTLTLEYSEGRKCVSVILLA